MKLYEPFSASIGLILLFSCLAILIVDIRGLVDDGDDDNQTIAEELLKEDGIIEEGGELAEKILTGRDRDWSPDSKE